MPDHAMPRHLQVFRREAHVPGWKLLCLKCVRKVQIDKRHFAVA